MKSDSDADADDYDYFNDDERPPRREEENESSGESGEEGFSSSSSSNSFDFHQLLAKHKDYYQVLEVDYDASEEAIRSSYIRLALKWHPDKKQDQGGESTLRFQEINEAYQVLGNSAKRREYDQKGLLHVYDRNIVNYLNRHKGLILTCNGLGVKHSFW
uniref:J domain-containing protein n=1 Tax=Kalanchoe fedtschenkoi TaxID=63787 RepID=A0A7N1A6D9_KALFE